MKLKLAAKKITSSDLVKPNSFNLKNNTFTTFIKKTNVLTKKFIYTHFVQNIENVYEYFDVSNVVVKAMVIDNMGNLYIGGDFNKIGNVTCNRVAKWNGKQWESLGDGLNGQVLSLAVDNHNNLWVGGSFDGTYNNLLESKSVIMWNDHHKSWHSVDGGVNSNVARIQKLSNGNIVIAGDFTSTVTSLTHLEKIGYWNGLNWVNLGEDFLIDKNIYALAVDQHDNLYIGGYNNLSASVYNWTSKTWSTLVNSNLDELNQIINTIIVNPVTNNPIFGGIIENFGTVTNVFNVVEYNINTNTWVPFTNSNGYGLDSQCYVLFYDKINKQVLAGGSFKNLTNGIDSELVLNNVAIWNGHSWNNMGDGINGNNVESFEITSKNELFIGGNIFGSKNVWASGLIIYTNNYINLFYKKKLLYILTNFEKQITISINACLPYIFNGQIGSII